MDSRKSNKIMEIVRLQQILKKWKKLANNNKTSSGSGSGPASVTLGIGGSKSMKFLKKTLSFTESSISSSSSSSSSTTDQVPKGYLAVCVGKELKRFVIPMEYLGHQAFGILLREAEEEFGFQQQGVLKIPCEVELFEKMLKLMEENRDVFFLNDHIIDHADSVMSCYSPDCDLTSPSHRPQMCR
ncbi:auxin-responsive SAUR72 [Olea europaea subsp. europaea]|uniref:Auxin-responsive SAUR72 n=1 Tax=Olea europaea subsp. europaea TaxID=158383 RepID=A0A8S0PXH3_OLEEU|nr:auxin-responsive SAUR72 [Olea europaea subsp. europaea]